MSNSRKPDDARQLLRTARMRVTASRVAVLEALGDHPHATADKIQAAADYIRENDFRAMAEDVSGVVRRYPGQALAAAVVVGFLAGRALWSRD